MPTGTSGRGICRLVNDITREPHRNVNPVPLRALHPGQGGQDDDSRFPSDIRPGELKNASRCAGAVPHQDSQYIVWAWIGAECLTVIQLREEHPGHCSVQTVAPDERQSHARCLGLQARRRSSRARAACPRQVCLRICPFSVSGGIIGGAFTTVNTHATVNTQFRAECHVPSVRS